MANISGSASAFTNRMVLDQVRLWTSRFPNDPLMRHLIVMAEAAETELGEPHDPNEALSFCLTILNDTLERANALDKATILWLNLDRNEQLGLKIATRH